jgi:stage II sporulation protein GA (sporulation sigma-E factor processing peptidase)
MKVYIEAVFLLNFLLDYMILFGTKKLLKIDTNNYHILLGSLFGSITTFLLTISLSNSIMIFLKIIISLLMNLISFGYNRLIYHTFYFYLISILLGGVIYLFDISLTRYATYFSILVIGYLTIHSFYKLFCHFHFSFSNTYQVSFIMNDQEYHFNGYLDTGNHLTSPFSKKPVILVDMIIPSANLFYIPYKAFNSEGILPCIRPDKIFINHKEISNCLVGFSKEKISIDGCRCILPNEIKERL